MLSDNMTHRLTDVIATTEETLDTLDGIISDVNNGVPGSERLRKSLNVVAKHLVEAVEALDRAIDRAEIYESN